jgi:hypothetical protein
MDSRKSSLLARALADGIEQAPRYRAKRVFAVTGKGFLKSEGVSKIRKLKTRESKKTVASWSSYPNWAMLSVSLDVLIISLIL